MKIVIYNGTAKAEIGFNNKSDLDKMIEGIKRSIENPAENQFITTGDKDNNLTAIYPAVMLQNSIIRIEP